MVIRLPSMAARGRRATSGYQSRSLLGGIKLHQAASASRIPETTSTAREKGRIRASSARQPTANPADIVPASQRAEGPSNQRAAAPQMMPNNISGQATIFKNTMPHYELTVIYWRASGIWPAMSYRMAAPILFSS